jgi:hypothetical protein
VGGTWYVPTLKEIILGLEKGWGKSIKTDFVDKGTKQNGTHYLKTSLKLDFKV